jgi:SAM-dependent MidA family methyltransferase
MWQLLGEPAVFHVIEVGSGDGALALSIVDACERMASGLAGALCYVASDYEPSRPGTGQTIERASRTHGPGLPGGLSPGPAVRRVSAAGLRAFRNVVGCILSNELLDNFPVHRFAIQDGRVREVFVTLTGGNFTEVLDEPSSSRIEERLASLGLALPEGYRGEVNLRLEDWTREVSSALDRGFVLTIDYGHEAADLYSPGNDHGTLACFHRHAVRNDPYQDIGQQDITSHVDFTTLMRLGDRHGLTTVGYTRQRRFLENLGFSPLLDALPAQGLSAARTELNRMAMMALVEPEDYGDFKVLAQAKGLRLSAGLLGFAKAGA